MAEADSQNEDLGKGSKMGRAVHFAYRESKGTQILHAKEIRKRERLLNNQIFKHSSSLF